MLSDFRIVTERVSIPRLLQLFILALLLPVLEGAKMIYLLALLQSLVGQSTEMGAMGFLGFSFNPPVFPINGVSQTVSIAITTFIIWLFQMIISLTSARMMIKTEMNLIEDIRLDVTNHIFTMSIDELGKVKAGQFHSLWQHVRHVGSLLKLMLTVVNSLLSTIVLMLLMVKLFPKGVVVFLIIWLIVFLIQHRFADHIRRLSFEMTHLNNKAMESLEQFLYAMRIIKVAGLEEREKQKHLSIHLQQADLAVKTAISSQFSNSLGEFMAFSSILGIIILASFFSIPSTRIMGFALLLIRTLPFVLKLAALRLQWATMQGPVENTKRFLIKHSNNSKKIDAANTKEKLGIIHNIKLQNVSYEYRKREEVLNSVSCEFEKGQMTAVIGLTGSGKSTLVDLLAGFRSPNKGEIFVNSTRPIEQILHLYREKVGYASQEPIIFNDTVEANLRFYCPDASDKEVERAIDLAQSHEFINKIPGRFDAKIGQRGMLISGGQRQRLSLARVFLQDSEILLLDEATSSLDLYTEANIFESLTRLKENKIIVVVTHRLSAISRFDKIIVLHKGEVEEQGSHQELLDSKGLYYSLYKLQE